jgi:hypothetical protein
LQPPPRQREADGDAGQEQDQAGATAGGGLAAPGRVDLLENAAPVRPEG